MRRSKSSLNVPSLKCEARKRAQSSTRMGSTVSTDHLTVVPKGPVSKKSASGGLMVPSTSRSGSRSPVNDKRRVNEQYEKVRRFLRTIGYEDHMPDMKPPTINTFIKITDLFLKKIDPEFTIASGTYKENVLETLKKIQYPGNVSNSLLKTVNTMHTWPQVIAMWSWLVDLITYINHHGLSSTLQLQSQQKYQLMECVLEGLCNRYIIYNRDAGEPTTVNEEFLNKFKNILNIETSEIVKFQKDVDEVAAKKEQQLLLLSKAQNRNELLEKEKSRMQYEIDSFYVDEQTRQLEQDDIIAKLKERKKKLQEATKNKQENILNRKKQAWTFLLRIKQLQHSNKEREKIIETRKRALDEARQELTTAVYRLNSTASKLRIHDPSLPVLELSTSEFVGIDFKKEFEYFVKTISHIIKQNHDASNESKALIQETDSKINVLHRQIKEVKTQLSKLTAEQKSIESQIEKCHQDIEVVSEKTMSELQMYSQKMKDLESSGPALKAAYLELRAATEDCQNIRQQFEKLIFARFPNPQI